MEKFIDLHIHSNFSDGILSPKEIIDEAKKNNVTTLSIADHDTIEAYNNDLYEYARKNNIQIINGVEISSKINKISVHILGYNFDINNQKLKDKLKALRNARHDYLYTVADKLKKLGYIVNINELNKIEAVTKAHISKDVINNPNNRDILLKEFNHIPNMGEFIETIMNEGCKAFVKKETITPIEAANLIRNAGGKVVLAHPMAFKYEDDLKDFEIEKLVEDMNADGIEANYIYISRDNQKIDETEKWNRFAEKHNLIATIGSDFHNKDGIHPEIGLTNVNFYLKNDEIKKIKNSILNN